jgi:uncharacterized protein YjdB
LLGRHTSRWATLAALALLGCGEPKEGSPVGLRINPDGWELPVGQMVAFQAIIDYQGSEGPSSKPAVTWSSSDDSVATIDARGQATGRAPGMATITATAAGMTASAALLVEVPRTLTAIQLTPPAPELPVGGTLALTATAIYSPRSLTVVTDAVSWASSAPDVVYVSDAGDKGVVAGRSAGEAIISATLGTVKGAIKVVVTPN